MAPLLVGVLPEHVGQVGQVDSVLHTACCLELPKKGVLLPLPPPLHPAPSLPVPSPGLTWSKCAAMRMYCSEASNSTLTWSSRARMQESWETFIVGIRIVLNFGKRSIKM